MFTKEDIERFTAFYDSLPTQPVSRGYVYFLHCETSKRVKIGRAATDNLVKRIRALCTIAPSRLSLIGFVQELPGFLEEELHSKFREYHAKNEWFSATPALLTQLKEMAEIDCDNCCRYFLPDYDLHLEYLGDFLWTDAHVLCDDCREDEDGDEG